MNFCDKVCLNLWIATLALLARNDGQRKHTSPFRNDGAFCHFKFSLKSEASSLQSAKQNPQNSVFSSLVVCIVPSKSTLKSALILLSVVCVWLQICLEKNSKQIHSLNSLSQSHIYVKGKGLIADRRAVKLNFYAWVLVGCV